MDVGGDVKPVIAIEDDVIDFPANDQRLVNKLVSFKEEGMEGAGEKEQENNEIE